MKKHLIAASVLAGISLLVTSVKADTSATPSAKPFLTPPQLALTTGTNWLASVAQRMELSGVYIATLNNGKAQIDRGGIATEYVIREYDINTSFRFRPGLCVTLPSDLATTFVGAGCVFGVVPDGSLEKWLNTAPIFELVAKAVKWSNLYGFFELGSQYDQWKPFVAFGGGVKVW
jgi:hypothetical protein